MTMSIGEAARAAGVRPSTLRYYESIGLLPVPERMSGQRRYDIEVLQRIAIIRTAQQAGFTLDELRILFDDILISASPATKWQTLIQRKMQELNLLLNNVMSMKILLEDIMECDGAELAECIYLTGERYRTVDHS